MNIALEVSCTEAEGPGRRYAIWVQGCPLRCPGCCNPEFLPLQGGHQRRVIDIVNDMQAAQRTSQIEGVSLLGGEPTSQAKGCADIAEAAHRLGLTVMVFSGFTLASLRARYDDDVDRLLASTDLLVDGPYIEARRTLQQRYVGSDNQVLHVLSSRASKDDPRLAAANTVELRVRIAPTGERTLVVNGWPVHGALTR